ncbi:MAG: hypothetical protein WAZ18_05050 [Alphaproteobacteria bacterium]
MDKKPHPQKPFSLNTTRADVARIIREVQQARGHSCLTPLPHPETFKLPVFVRNEQRQTFTAIYLHYFRNPEGRYFRMDANNLLEEIPEPTFAHAQSLWHGNQTVHGKTR